MSKRRVAVTDQMNKTVKPVIAPPSSYHVCVPAYIDDREDMGTPPLPAILQAYAALDQAWQLWNIKRPHFPSVMRQ